MDRRWSWDWREGEGEAERMRVPDRQCGRRAVEAASRIGGLARGIAASTTGCRRVVRGAAARGGEEDPSGRSEVSYVAAACGGRGGGVRRVSSERQTIVRGRAEG
jgi:hypothetical protein